MARSCRRILGAMEVIMKEDCDRQTVKKWRQGTRGGGGNIAYCLGFIGSLIYYVQQSHGFWPFVAAFLKACAWPAFVVYHVLVLLGK